MNGDGGPLTPEAFEAYVQSACGRAAHRVSRDYACGLVAGTLGEAGDVWAVWAVPWVWNDTARMPCAVYVLFGEVEDPKVHRTDRWVRFARLRRFDGNLPPRTNLGPAPRARRARPSQGAPTIAPEPPPWGCGADGAPRALGQPPPHSEKVRSRPIGEISARTRSRVAEGAVTLSAPTSGARVRAGPFLGAIEPAGGDPSRHPARAAGDFLLRPPDEGAPPPPRAARWAPSESPRMAAKRKNETAPEDAAGAAPEVAAVWVHVDELKGWDRNPRKNDGAPTDKVAASIKRFGFASPIVARRADGEIIAGHTRLKAALQLGLDRVPVRYLDLDPAEAHLLALADNKLNEQAAWDYEALSDLLRELEKEDGLLVGFSEGELDALVRAQWEPPALEPDGLDGDPAGAGGDEPTGAPVKVSEEQREAFDRAVALARGLHRNPKLTEGEALEAMACFYLVRAPSDPAAQGGGS